MFCLPQPNISFCRTTISFHTFLICPREYIQNMAKTCRKAHICQGAMWQGMAGPPRRLPGRTAPARAGPTIPARSRAGWGGTAGSWGRHVCPLFTVGTGRIHGRAQTTELSSVRSLVGHGQFWNSRLPNASPQPSTISIAILDSPGPFFPCCALAHAFLNQQPSDIACSCNAVVFLGFFFKLQLLEQQGCRKF